MTEMTKIQTLLRAYNRAYLVSLQSQEELFSLARMVGAAIDERLDELPNRSAEVEGTEVVIDEDGVIIELDDD